MRLVLSLVVALGLVLTAQAQCAGNTVITDTTGSFNDGTAAGADYGTGLDCSWTFTPSLPNATFVRWTHLIVAAWLTPARARRHVFVVPLRVLNRKPILVGGLCSVGIFVRGWLGSPCFVLTGTMAGPGDGGHPCPRCHTQTVEFGADGAKGSVPSRAFFFIF